MSWFLDTNICIYLLKGLYPGLRERLISKKPSDIKIPSIVLAELYVGSEISEEPAEISTSIAAFAGQFEIVPFDERAAIKYGKIRAGLIKNKLKVGPNDLAIAATIMSRDGILVTNNEKDFSRIDKLMTENWTV
ncbi:MAG: type II toxin-antitoxin system VapC family toxin [Clostridiales Family XIII bacterium]|jgi:tRNA(fMet)-specific endonuclease VapC|nr:type II toxin-antitoxin system VapC family toxin [Clostridiales Family XIII bacterium]